MEPGINTDMQVPLPPEAADTCQGQVDAVTQNERFPLLHCAIISNFGLIAS